MARSSTSHISVRSFNTYEPCIGLINDSRKPRVTEIEAINRMRWGDPIPATDTIGDARRAGQCQCRRCLQYKDKSDFSKYKKGESEYQRPYCKPCRVAMERTRRFSDVEPVSPYPARFNETTLAKP